MHQLFQKAIKHTGNGKEGDYLKWHCQGWTVKATISGNSNEGYDLNILYDVSYLSSLEQEEKVDEEVSNLLKSLDLSNKTDYQKVKAIYDYICSNVTYDHDNLNDESYSLKYTAYDKLGTKASAGCIRLTVADAYWIYSNCASGTNVEFYSSSDPGPLGKPSAQKISSNEKCRNWDPTDPLPNNPWKGYTEPASSTVEQPKKEDTKQENTNNNSGSENTKPQEPTKPAEQEKPEEPEKNNTSAGNISNSSTSDGNNTNTSGNTSNSKPSGNENSNTNGNETGSDKRNDDTTIKE